MAVTSAEFLVPGLRVRKIQDTTGDRLFSIVQFPFLPDLPGFSMRKTVQKKAAPPVSRVRRGNPCRVTYSSGLSEIGQFPDSSCEETRFCRLSCPILRPVHPAPRRWSLVAKGPADGVFCEKCSGIAAILPTRISASGLFLFNARGQPTMFASADPSAP